MSNINDTNKVTIIAAPNTANTVKINTNASPNVISVIEKGPKGNVGIAGEQGRDGAGLPFTYVSHSFETWGQNIYSTTSSIAIFGGQLSSSLVPFVSGSSTYISEYSLGSGSKAWKDIYVSTSSLKFVDPFSGVVSTIIGGREYIQTGDSRITTESFGFVRNNIFDPILIKQGNFTKIEVTGSLEVKHGNNNPVNISSGTFSALQVNGVGVIKLGDFQYTPAPVDGGLIFSASNFFVGI